MGEARLSDIGRLAEHLWGLEGRIIILLHANADLDAVCSGIALAEAIRSINPALDPSLGAPGGISKAARRAMDHFGATAEASPVLDADLIILVDTVNLAQLGPAAEKVRQSGARKAVIDHHAPQGETKAMADFYLVDEGAASSVEVVYRFIESTGVEVTPGAATAMVLGILAETGRLRLATPGTIKALASLLDRGADYPRALELLEEEEDRSRKLAHLKAAQRMELHRLGAWLVATAEVGSFTASAAGALVHLGADCAFVASGKGGKVQVSARASAQFLRATGVSLAEVMERVGGVLGGGGGHAA
ncbi:MAG: DHH family phosphoesterase, partial [Euryarchaeota archaeon]|nr:DHH family phosphoesterase [Euryarchaeota archaeon]